MNSCIALPDTLLPENVFFIRGKQAIYILLLVPFFINAVVFGHLNPFDLSTEEFAFFYMLLCLLCIVVMLMAHRKKKSTLHDLVISLIPYSGKFGLAYLAGGSDRFTTMCLTDLMQSGFLVWKNGAFYMNKETLKLSDNPVYDYLYLLDTKQAYSLSQLKPYFLRAAQQAEKKYYKLENEYSKLLVNMVFPFIVTAIGVHALSSSPAAQILAFAAIFAFVLMPIILNNIFKSACRTVMYRDEIAEQTQFDEITLDVIFAGAYGLIGLVEENLQAEIYANLEEKPPRPVHRPRFSGGYRW